MKHPLFLPMMGLLAALGAPVRAEEGAFYQGNAALQEGKIDAATVFYQKAQKGGFSAATSAQLARCHEAKGQIGEAFLELERARRMDPHNPSLREAQQEWFQKYPLPHPRTSRFENALMRASATFWSCLACIAVWLLLLLVAWPKTSLKPALRQTLWGIDVFLFLSVVPAIYYLEQKHRQAIAVREAPLRVAPTERSPTLPPLPDGSHLYPQKRHDDFFYVTTPDRQRSGWVASQDLEWIIPRSS